MNIPSTNHPLRARPLPPIARRVLGSAFFEALATPHGVSRYLEKLSPAWSLDPTTAVVRTVTRQPGAVTLGLRRAAPAAPHRAGQHVRLAVEIDGRLHTRCYSITDPEGADPRELNLTVRTHAQGLVSRHLADAVPGLVVQVSEPAGSFVLPAERHGRAERILLVSGGSGMTPVLSMVRTLVREGHRGRITFLHYARTADAVLHGAELAELAALSESGAEVDVVTIFTRAAGSGHVSRAQLDSVVPDWREARCFACGPIPMLETLSDIFDAEGLGDRLHREQFTAPALPAPEAGQGVRGTTRFTTSAVAVENDGRSLLLQAEAAGLAPASGCRMGICHSCTRTLSAGTVRDLRTGELIEGPARDLQLCISAAVGDVDIEL